MSGDGGVLGRAIRGERMPTVDVPERSDQGKRETDALWRFDVPEVPPGVTALKVEGCLIVRVPDMPSVPGGWWKQRFSDGTVDNAKPLSVWLQFAPLVECPDPRAAS